MAHLHQRRDAGLADVPAGHASGAGSIARATSCGASSQNLSRGTRGAAERRTGAAGLATGGASGRAGWSSVEAIFACEALVGVGGGTGIAVLFAAGLAYQLVPSLAGCADVECSGA